MEEQISTRPVHNIGVVERRTGIKSDLLRAWERRYGAVVPERTPTDRRLYSDADIRRLMLLRDATRLGHRIGHIASLTDAELQSLFQQSSGSGERTEPVDHRPELEGRLGACIDAIEALDAPRLTAELERASFDFGRIALVEDLLVPLMDGVGTRWLHGDLDPAQEHLATAAVRSFVSGFLGSAVLPGAPAIVVTTPAGQLHELGAILAAAVAAAEGWRVVYLGPNLPAESISGAVRRSGAMAVALGITYPDGSPDLVAAIEATAGVLEGVALLVGGRGASTLEPAADRLGLLVISNLVSFRSVLASLSPPATPLAGDEALPS